jgi:AcrR family transcriptional regulator
MTSSAPPERAVRTNRQRRTRKDLLKAAARLMRQGVKPSLEQIAEEALVSRATAYRYFASADALLLEASLDLAIPGPDDLFDQDAGPGGLAERLERVDAALHEVTVANEAALRTMLSQSVLRAMTPANIGIPVRQDRRTPLIEAAVDGADDGLNPAALDLLRKAVALLVGPEAMIVCWDVLQLDDAEARRTKRWAIQALVDAARRLGDYDQMSNPGGR